MNQATKYGLFLLGGIAIGAIGTVALSKGKLKVKPMASNLLSDGMDLKDKLMSGVDTFKEELADVIAEAKVKSEEKREAAEAAQAATESKPETLEAAR